MTAPTGECYEIVISKRLGTRSAAAFDGFDVVPIPDDGTLLRGRVADQAALHGVLGRLRDLGIPLVSVRRVDGANRTGRESDQPG